MRQKTSLIPTLRTVSEAEMISHQLLLRAGYMRQVAAGVYSFLPLGQRVLQKIIDVVRDELNRAGAQELLMPALNPAELWQESGRYNTYGPELVKLQDRHGRDFILGPTHEETITDLVRGEVNTYKKLPMTLYQIQTKFRDEKRPRSGLLRGREFLMKDAYSFHADRESLDQTYEELYQAYVNIFTRLGLNFRAVEADAGAIGGKGTHEFMVLSDAGEDTIATCEACDYAANIEMAEVIYKEQTHEQSSIPAPEKVDTPGKKSIEDVSSFLNLPSNQFIKSLFFIVDEEPVLVLVRGDHEVNEVKVKNLLDASVCELADEETVRRIAGVETGFVGPVGLKEKVKIIADQAVQSIADGVMGANLVDTHLVHVQPKRDFTVDQYADIRQIQEGDACPRCGGMIQFERGIEVGHVFKLGTKYSEAMNANFLDANGKEQPFIMGCYGIGISRLVAAIIEQHHDENGMIWPINVAPFAVHLIAVNMKKDEQATIAEGLYEKLTKAGIEVLFDDRFERAGVKFKDADLMGIPVRITVGAKASEGMVEIKLRRTGESAELAHEDVLKDLPNWLQKADQ
ncbi:proline--tRNA ligase [Thermoflavimicrobium daqui]|jgi:prolyl-tRNA synthetase|uniref:Proline--tRNA ligase n=1 Tax=Thermoflavimicrobium daqui TaxID=2137476 RepID=A0A364K7Q1_9BACL|nr:proline--tRNA ligase [Thermoflavimicrobium daqui]RAL26326.1 proline--tRNA ligase [Thermoflavimicrobium daqui]